MTAGDTATLRHNWRRGKAFLASRGLNLIAVFDLSSLQAPAAQLLVADGVEVKPWQRLLLLGNGGGRFWRRLAKARTKEGGDFFSDANPVDRYSSELGRQLFADYLSVASAVSAPVLPLYPGPITCLQRLGELAGWQHASPLGLGVHPRYGPWFAYRLALLSDLELPLSEPELGSAPCTNCADKPCVSACPAGALSVEQAPAMRRCFDYRLSNNSRCEAQCLARLACPAGKSYRYPSEQIDYHYRRMLRELRAAGRQ